MTQLSRDTRAILAAARADDHISSKDKARIRGKLAQSIRMGVAAGSAVTLGATMAEAARSSVLGSLPMWTPVAAKVMAAVAMTTAVGVGVVRMSQPGSQLTAQVPTHTRAAVKASGAPRVSSGAALREVPVIPAEAPAEINPAPSQVSSSSVSPAQPSAPNQSPTSAGTNRSKSAPALEPNRQDVPIARSEPAVSSTKQVEVPSATSDELLAEIAAIKEARAAIRRGDGQRALQIIDSIQRSGVYGALDEESSLIRVQAFCTLGNRAQALDVASRFLALHPQSPLATKMRESCAFAPIGTR